METELRTNLQTIATLFSSATGLALSTIGMRCARDARFFTRLDDGKSFTVRTYDTLIQWFSDNWPENTEWPADIDRPFETRGAA